MQTKYFIYLTGFLLFMAMSCKKEDPKPVDQTSSPVFTFSGEINGAPVSLQAGINNVFITSSYTLNQNGVYQFNSVFGAKNCSSNCPNSLKISINDYRPYTVKPTAIDSSIAVGNYPFVVPSGVVSRFNQTFSGGLINKTGVSYSWDFGDGTPVTQVSTYTITHAYLQPGTYNVTLTVKDSSLCTSSITNTVKLGQTNNLLTATYYPVNTVGDSVLFTPAPTGGTAPYSYSWDFGDGTFSASVNPVHEYTSPGVYLTGLTLTDAAGNSNTQHVNINVPSTYGCASFFYSSTLNTVLDPLDLKGIIIEWTDPSGTVWTSDNDLQSSASSSFKIVSVENYLNNESGDPTKKIQLEFSCKLYNGRNSIDLKNAKSTIAVAYKK